MCLNLRTRRIPFSKYNTIQGMALVIKAMHTDMTQQSFIPFFIFTLYKIETTTPAPTSTPEATTTPAPTSTPEGK